jgi:crotonobetainyl-CoA:carnitine CoA-transferase CaiB-like acyl-CoA transferase
VKEIRNLLDESGVACEISSPDFILDFFNDQTNVDKQRLTTFNDPLGGKTTAIGRLIDFSETPGKIWGPPLVVGDHTREILEEAGFAEDAITAFYERRIVRDSESTSAP